MLGCSSTDPNTQLQIYKGKINKLEAKGVLDKRENIFQWAMIKDWERYEGFRTGFRSVGK